MAPIRTPLHSVAALPACLLVVALGVAGCSRSPEADLAQARGYIERHDSAGAQIALKAYLQNHPDAGEARYLLGVQLLRRLDAASAVIELERAQRLGFDPAQVVPALAKAQLAAGRPQRVIDDFAAAPLSEPAARAALAATVAQAWVQLGQAAKAHAVVAQALQGAPDAPPLLLTQAWLAEPKDGPAAALGAVDALLARHPDCAEAWVYRAELRMRVAGDVDDALSATRRALALQPDLFSARAGLVALLLQRSSLPEAREALAALKRLAPRFLATGLMDAQLAVAEGDRPRARSIYQAMLRSMAEHPALLLAAAENEHRLGDAAQAELLAAKLVARYPGDLAGRRLLAELHLAKGAADKAARVLAPLVDRADVPADVLAWAAQAERLDGRPARAEALFARLAAMKPADPRLRTLLATAGPGALADPAAVPTALAAIAADDDGISADLALYGLRMRAGDGDGALAAAQAIVRKRPGQPLPLQLKAQALLLRQDALGARQAFEAALAADADYLPAIRGLAVLDLADRAPAVARSRLDALLRRQPNDVAARLALAEVLRRSDAPDAEVGAELARAMRLAPERADLRLALIRHERDQGRWREAQALAQAAVAALPDQPELLEQLARLQEARGDDLQARASYAKLAVAHPGVAAGHLGLARLQLAASQWAPAERSIERVLSTEPDHAEALALLTALNLRRQRFDAALQSAHRLQRARPLEASGFLVEAEVAAAQGRWAQAAEASRRALDKAEPGLAPLKLHQALLRAGRATEARAFAERWLREHPRDTAFRFYEADAAAQSGDTTAAEQGYRAVLAIDPRHVPSLNNLAMLRLRAGEPDAQALAERAVQAAPRQAAVLDTLAQVHAAAGRWTQAIDVQSRAVALAPRAADLRLRLAQYQQSARHDADAQASLRRIVDERLVLTDAQREDLQSRLRTLR